MHPVCHIDSYAILCYSQRGTSFSCVTPPPSNNHPQKYNEKFLAFGDRSR